MSSFEDDRHYDGDDVNSVTGERDSISSEDYVSEEGARWYEIDLPPVKCRSEEGWYWMHTYPDKFAKIVTEDGQIPAFLRGKIEPITEGVLKAELQRCPSGWMKTEFPDWTPEEEAGPGSPIYSMCNPESIQPQKVHCQSEEGWYWEFDYPHPRPRVRIYNGKIPNFLVDKVAPLSPGVRWAYLYPRSDGTWTVREALNMEGRDLLSERTGSEVVMEDPEGSSHATKDNSSNESSLSDEPGKDYHHALVDKARARQYTLLYTRSGVAFRKPRFMGHHLPFWTKHQVQESISGGIFQYSFSRCTKMVGFQEFGDFRMDVVVRNPNNHNKNDKDIFFEMVGDRSAYLYRKFEERPLSREDVDKHSLCGFVSLTRHGRRFPAAQILLGMINFNGLFGLKSGPMPRILDILVNERYDRCQFQDILLNEVMDDIILPTLDVAYLLRVRHMDEEGSYMEKKGFNPVGKKNGVCVYMRPGEPLAEPSEEDGGDAPGVDAQDTPMQTEEQVQTRGNPSLGCTIS